MKITTLTALTGLAAVGLLSGCKPPPTDAAVARVSLLAPASGPSDPLPSPDTSLAIWSQTSTPLRLVYGVPGQPVLLALECLEAGQAEARLRITRHAPADEGAAALLALIGNGWIGRFPVGATAVDGRMLWQGEMPARTREWNALKPELGDRHRSGRGAGQAERQPPAHDAGRCVPQRRPRKGAFGPESVRTARCRPVTDFLMPDVPAHRA